jgi:hypothetical protein
LRRRTACRLVPHRGMCIRPPMHVLTRTSTATRRRSLSSSRAPPPALKSTWREARNVIQPTRSLQVTATQHFPAATAISGLRIATCDSTVVARTEYPAPRRPLQAAVVPTCVVDAERGPLRFHARRSTPPYGAGVPIAEVAASNPWADAAPESTKMVAAVEEAAFGWRGTS